MTVEPISSVMTLQAQQVQKPAATEGVSTANAEQVATQNMDTTVKPIEKVQAKSDGSQGSQTSTEQQNENQDQDKLKKAVEQINKKMSNSEAIYGIHEGTNRVTIKLVDKDTKEVIKELPPEKTLDMIAKAWEMAGILVDEKR